MRDVACSGDGHSSASIRLRRMEIDTYREPVIYMRADCEVCRAEGFEARSRIEVRCGDRHIVATLNVVRGELLAHGEAGLSDSAWRLLGAREGDVAHLAHPQPVESLRHVRAKVFGRRLDREAFAEVIGDIVQDHYSEIDLAAFLAASCGERLDFEEIVSLTRAMVEAGDRLWWDRAPVVDKHCVGGLPGNRTTPIVVPIVAALGLCMPKTSSRAITSPAGTADTMETLASVDLDAAAVRRVVEREGGCIVWGGSVRLSPADDVLIRVERALDLDGEGQLVASVLSKKVAAGSTHVVIDVPVGPTAKVRSPEAAAALGELLTAVGARVGLTVRVIRTDGSQPVGRGIGPALEARDVCAVLRGDADAPHDLRDRAVLLAGHVIEMADAADPGAGPESARRVLADGSAWRKFQAICEAQGGMREPPVATHRREIVASRAGVVASIDNRRLARIAKLAGAPKAAVAGVDLHVRVRDRVEVGTPLFSVHARAPGELDYALTYLAAQEDVVAVGDSA